MAAAKKSPEDVFAQYLRDVTEKGQMRVRFTLVGKSPLLMCRPYNLKGAGEIRGIAPAGWHKYIAQQGADEAVEQQAYRSLDGHIIALSRAVKRAMITAGSDFTDPVQSRRHLNQAIGRGVFATTAEFPIVDEHGELLYSYKEYSHRVVNHNAIGNPAMIATRPGVPVPWFVRCEFMVDLIKTYGSTAPVAICAKSAGRNVGIGAFRPELTGEYGTFEVADWAEELVQAKAA